jgi:predicted nucleotidyltransferase
MKRDEVLLRLAANREELARLGVQSLALFGSVAREEADPASDVDLLVEFEGGATPDRFLALESYLQELLGCSIDLLTRRSLRPALRSVIEKDVRYVPGLSAVSG